MVIALFRPLRPTGQKNVRQKNEEDELHSSFFCLTFFCLVAETLQGRLECIATAFQSPPLLTNVNV
jgi:hypothetical protein